MLSFSLMLYFIANFLGVFLGFFGVFFILKSNSVFAAHYVDAGNKNVISVLSVWSPILFFFFFFFFIVSYTVYGCYNDRVSKNSLKLDQMPSKLFHTSC